MTTHPMDNSELTMEAARPASTFSSSKGVDQFPGGSEEGIDGGVVQLNRRSLKRFKLAYAVSTFGFSPAFAGMITYGLFQLQTIGFMIGHEPGFPPGTGCMPGAQACRVPWAGRGDVNLTSFILYLNAISYAVSGLLTFFISSLGDHMRFKREQYVFFVVIYGVLCLPLAAMTKFDLKTFNTIAALYATFNIVGFLVQAWMKIFVPYTMQTAVIEPVQKGGGADQDRSPSDPTSTADPVAKRQASEKAGVQMSVWSSNAMQSSFVLFYLIYIGISYASFTAQSQAGLWITTGAGALCILLSLASWRFLPNPKKLESQGPTNWFLLSFSTFGELWRGLRNYPEAFKYLIAYTIYNDSNFAFSNVIGQLFNLSIRPGVREFTAYSMTSPIASVLFLTLWYFILPRTKLSLRHWIVCGYSVMAFVCFWCLLGLSASSKVGFKNRWEFYLMALLQGFSNAITSSCFTVLFCQLFPKGKEIRYFGFQLVLSCSTVWIPQVVDGPIVDATNNIRLPAIISFVFFLISTGLAWWTDEVKGIERVRELEERKEGL
ncbi:hypothetical protein IE53DRAFT_378283 [Violaceomyces palustris]|uniref:Uncharacterized protein n=1 Tax=Violaceomyces palustris TaxID=1673888 RepID=A0ACD0P294_9BASI|nr:hypothetical protein IE53DRAFT_378283 [Violaceomyces palustris]